MADSALARHHLIFFLIPLLYLLFSIAPTHQAVPLGSSLSTRDENSPWVSSKGEFAFGFLRLPNNNDLYLLAIWFQKIPEKTVVWSANRDKPVQRESKVELTKDGQLVLYDHQGIEIWKRKADRAASASMLDTGNFVLLSMNSSYIWQSFNEPTDTILPTQILNKPSKLSSPQRETDYSTGKFQLRLQEDGNLVLYLVALPSEFTYAPYWISNTSGSGLRLIFDEKGYIHLTQTNGTNASITPGDIVSPEKFYHRATLDFDGVFRQYVYPRTSDRNGTWSQAWSVVMFQPPNVCLAVLTPVGSGVCGFNSYCMLDQNQKPSCLCPTGYTYLDPKDPFGGCKQDFVQQSCELGGSVEETNKFEMKEMRNVDWPRFSYEIYSPYNEDDCRQACLVDCYCSVALFKDDTCWKKKMPLSNGKIDYNVSRKTLIKTPRTNSPPLIPPPASSCKDRTTLILVESALFGFSGLLNILLLWAICLLLLCSYRWRKLKSPSSNANMLGIRIHSFTYKELEQATNGFKEELDSGPFGAVYKGVIVLDSRHLVAVKKLNNVESTGESDKEFETEVTAIGQTHHKHLVRLLGFCNGGPHRLLVYGFMSSGSLASFLFGSMRPDWNQRMQIALGVARGLTYLHEECSIQIIHCDINPQNIVLDELFTAKISDFGLAKLMKTEQTRSITSIRGTKGYVAPEWFKNMPITAKVDVYSFGVLLLEIICCRRNIEMGLENEERIILTDWAYDCYVQRKLDLLVENDEEAMNDMKRVERLVMVAIWCIQENPLMRPGMEKVTEMLEGVAEVCQPLHPYSMSSFVSS